MIKNRISIHQESSPTPIIDAVDRLARGTQVIAHQATLMAEEVRILRDANTALAKRRRAKRTRLQRGRALSQEKLKILLEEKGKGKRPAPVDVESADPSKRNKTTFRRYRVCGETGHNARICLNNRELSRES